MGGRLHDVGPGPRRRRADGALVVGVATGSADAARYGTPDDAFNWAEEDDLRADAKNRIEHWPVWKPKFYGAFTRNHAIDAPPAHG